MVVTNTIDYIILTIFFLMVASMAWNWFKGTYVWEYLVTKFREIFGGNK